MYIILYMYILYICIHIYICVYMYIYIYLCNIYIYMHSYIHFVKSKRACKKFGKEKEEVRIVTLQINILNCLSSAAKKAAIDGNTSSINHAASGVIQ